MASSEEQQQQQDDKRKIPLKILVDKKRNKVVFVETTPEFIDTLFSFLSLPLGTIIRLLFTNNNNNKQQQPHLESSDESQFLGSIRNLYKSVQNIIPHDVWNNLCCKQMLLHPSNPCESLCMNLFLNIDDTEPRSKIFVCGSCRKFTTFQNLNCTCGYLITNKFPVQNLDSESKGNSVDGQNGVFVSENGSMFMVFDDLKIVPSSLVISMQLLMELGYSDLTQLEEIKQNIGKQEILNLLKYALTSNEPLTNTLLASSSKNKDNPPIASTFKGLPCTGTGSKVDIKVVQSKSQKKIIHAEANGDFVNFIFSFLTMPLGSIVKLLDGNSFAGCVGNLYKSVENLDSSLCTNSRSMLLNPGIAPLFGCPNQPLNIPDIQPAIYYYGTAIRKGEVISKTKLLQISNAQVLTALDPRSSNRSKGVVGFVKRETLYSIGDDLTVKPLSANSCLSYLKKLGIALDDLEVKMISIGEAEALSLLGASLTSKFTLTDGLGDHLNVPNQEST